MGERVQSSYPPRAMRLDDAAAYLAYSRSTFLRLVDEGVMPLPIKTPDHNVSTWDRLDLDAAYEELKNPRGSSEHTTDRRLQELEDVAAKNRRKGKGA